MSAQTAFASRELEATGTFWQIPYVRSLYCLAKIHEKRGDTVKSREYFQRFLGFWKYGDLDRDLVKEAERKLAS